ncbi:MAG: hypothetical protein ACRENG_22370 [bacterium]
MMRFDCNNFGIAVKKQGSFENEQNDSEVQENEKCFKTSERENPFSGHSKAEPRQIPF